MPRVTYEGWAGCLNLRNDAIELIAPTLFGPRILAVSALGRQNLLGIDADLKGVVAHPDTWVNYGGHRLWIAPQAYPRTYAPDNSPVTVAGDSLDVVLTQPTDASTGIEKQLRVTIGPDDSPAARIVHRLTNRGDSPVTLAPWALSVLAPGGRVILPQAAFHDQIGYEYLAPARPLVLWPWTDMSDPRWTWGRHFIQLRSDETRTGAQKLGLYSPDGWAAYVAANGDVLFIFIDTTSGPEAHTDMGCNFETYTDRAFQELETLGPETTLEPTMSIEHTQRWIVTTNANLPQSDEDLALVLPALAKQARTIAYSAFPA